VTEERCSFGVDVGGTTITVAEVDARGQVRHRIKRPTEAEAGPEAVKEKIVSMVQELLGETSSDPVAVGVGVAGQVHLEEGVVRFAPNLDWYDVSIGSDLSRRLDLPVMVTNDVRAATWGEWIHGAGQGYNELVCLFVGTGIGGGVVCNGEMIIGCEHCAGELGHTTIDMYGPLCHCGNRGCMEALAGGWAIARQAQKAVVADPLAGAGLLEFSEDGRKSITAKTVTTAFYADNPLAREIVDAVTRALIAGVANVLNTFNPSIVILGGGVIEGLPELVRWIEQGVRMRALGAATMSLQVRAAALGDNAGVVGAAAYAMRSFAEGADKPQN
jgi:glucokinase